MGWEVGFLGNKMSAYTGSRGMGVQVWILRTHSKKPCLTAHSWNSRAREAGRRILGGHWPDSVTNQGDPALKQGGGLAKWVGS